MPIASGTRLGPFEILSPLGAGGMGEVWRARDTRLQREVAIKVLPAALASDLERLARFEREARLLASMNHPRIGGLLGLEDADGVPALVLELIEGPTLAQYLAKQGALPPAEAIEVAHQIAEAMEYAHECGIIHRDLKPANVKFTGDGTVKVLDFGLAKALLGDEGSGSDPQISQSPTLTLGTHAGVILGTAAYMAPEQARGKAVDRRADIWAFGVMLFEMLSARPLFGGETVSDTIARILEREPDWNLLPPQTPERVRELLRRCLEKDTRKRLRDIGDAKLDLEAARRDMASGIVPAASGARARVSALVWLGVAILVAAAFVGGLWLRGLRRGGQTSVVRLSVVPPPDISIRRIGISADGRTLFARGEGRAVESGQEPAGYLYRRKMDGFSWEPIPGTTDVSSYDVPPDGQWVYFLGPSARGSSQMQLSRVAVDGSAPPTLVAPWNSRWYTWSTLPDGGFAVIQGWDSVGIVEPARTTPRKWTRIKWELPVQKLDLHAALPGGRGCLGTASYYSPSGWNIDAVALDLTTGQVNTLAKNAASPRLTPQGRLLLTRGNSVLAAPFDVKKMRRTAEPVTVFEGVRIANVWEHGAINVSGDGTLVYAPGKVDASQRWVGVLRPDGHFEEWNGERRAFEGAPSISPDGRTVALTSVPPGQAVYEVLVLTRGQLGARRLAAATNEDCAFPSYSPDGRSVVFMRQGNASAAGVYVIESQGVSPARRVL
ncbi:MAG: protein kinase, partial [Candidatus Eisenbacteria bacterium]